MIKVQNLTPDIYYNRSRDFQFIGRLYDVVLNSVKTNADILYNIPLTDNSPDNIADLLATTLGFKIKHHYTAKQLKILCSVLPLALRNKGNIKSMIYVANAIINAEGCDQELEYDLEDNNTVLNLYLPPDLADVTILKDVFDYVLPAGMSCNITKQLVFNETAQTDIGVNDILTYKTGTQAYYDSNTLSILPQLSTDEISALTAANVGTTAGMLANSSIYKPTITYILLTSSTAPTDWATNYTSYYKVNKYGKYVQIEAGNTAPVYTANTYYSREETL